MKLEDVLLQVIEQQVESWAYRNKCSILEREEFTTRKTEHEGLAVTLKYQVDSGTVQPHFPETLRDPVSFLTVHTVLVNDDCLIVGLLSSARVREQGAFCINLDGIEIETTGPYTNW